MSIANINHKRHESRLAKLFSAVTSIAKMNDDPDHKNEIMLPKDIKAEDLANFVEGMIKDAQPRHLRKEGRPSHIYIDYRIPVNYFTVESNSVPYHATMGYITYPSMYSDGSIVQEGDDDFDDITTMAEDTELGLDTAVKGSGKMKHKGKYKPKIKYVGEYKEEKDPNRTSLTVDVTTPALAAAQNTRDFASMICAHIFDEGRKTIDELVEAIKGMDKRMMTILIYKMVEDRYLQIIEEDDVDPETKEVTHIKTFELVPILEPKVEKALEEKKKEEGPTVLIHDDKETSGLDINSNGSESASSSLKGHDVN